MSHNAPVKSIMIDPKILSNKNTILEDRMNLKSYRTIKKTSPYHNFQVNPGISSVLRSEENKLVFPQKKCNNEKNLQHNANASANSVMIDLELLTCNNESKSVPSPSKSKLNSHVKPLRRNTFSVSSLCPLKSKSNSHVKHLRRNTYCVSSPQKKRQATSEPNDQDVTSSYQSASAQVVTCASFGDLKRQRSLFSSNNVKWICPSYESSASITPNADDSFVNMLKPTLYLEELKQQSEMKFEVQTALSTTDFFLKATEEHYASYKQEIITAIGAQDINKLRQLQRNGWSMQCCNRFGESIVHMACRRGFTEVVDFLIREGNVSLRIHDDYGRNPAHDVCWTPTPNFELMEMMMKEEPSLMFRSDSRGHSPLDYVRREHWDEWVTFLSSRKHLLFKSEEMKEPEPRESIVTQLPRNSSMQAVSNFEGLIERVTHSENDLKLINSSVPSCTDSSTNNVLVVNMLKPTLYIEQILLQRGSKYVVEPAFSLSNFFSEPTEEQYASYKQEIINAIRSQDICKLRELKKAGWSLQCCNKFRESLIHMACRRSFTKVVEFLIREGGVSLRLRDDYGRTPMHDACWTPTPNFELIEMLMKEEPSLLYISDSRGHTPLDYVRREYFDDWITFLSCHKPLLSQGDEKHRNLMNSLCSVKT